MRSQLEMHSTADRSRYESIAAGIGDASPLGPESTRFTVGETLPDTADALPALGPAHVRKRFLLFLPALIMWPVWGYTLTYNGLWTKVFSKYWPMTLAMILGSFLAGSTPLGGGVVAYPVTQLLLVFDAADSRDASVLVQSIGMNAAAYLLWLVKREMLDVQLILYFSVFGVFGVLSGLSLRPSSGLANILFSCAIFFFAIAYFYVSEVQPPAVGDAVHVPKSNDDSHARTDSRQRSRGPSSRSTGSGEDASGRRDGHSLTHSDRVHIVRAPVLASEHAAAVVPVAVRLHRPAVTLTLMASCAFVGGLITSCTGSGSDICLYAFGVFGWNTLQPQMRRSNETLTASSVVVMGLLSAVTALTRALTEGLRTEVLLCWGADAFIVVVGAPVGALVLSPHAALQLRRLFYALALFQFVSYASMEEAFFDAAVAPHVGAKVWIYIGVFFAVELSVLCGHFRSARRAAAGAAVINADGARGMHGVAQKRAVRVDLGRRDTEESVGEMKSEIGGEIDGEIDGEIGGEIDKGIFHEKWRSRVAANARGGGDEPGSPRARAYAYVRGSGTRTARQESQRLVVGTTLMLV
uniref:Uncharacterized protein n=1 Tax=Chrysotila carterae TaxID=13221 RepID=A0A7S4BTS2_CHRCT